MQFLVSSIYSESFARLALADQRRVHRTLIKICALSPRHPSMQAHRLQIRPALWELYVTGRALRLLYDQPSPALLRLWNVGGHPILEWARRAPTTLAFTALCFPSAWEVPA